MRNSRRLLLALAALSVTVATDAPGIHGQDATPPPSANAPTQDAQATPEAGRIAGTTVLLSREAARLGLELESGDQHEIELGAGDVRIDGRRVGSYEPGGAFDRAWRDLLRNPQIDEAGTLGELLAGWDPPAAAGGAAESGRAAVLEALERFTRAATPEATSPVDAPADAGERVTIVPRAGSIGQLAERLRELNDRLGRIAGGEFELDGDFALVVNDDYRIADGTTIPGDVALLGGDLVVEGEIDGDVMVLGGELLLEPGSRVMGDIRSLGGGIETTGATVTGEILTLSEVERPADRVTSDVERDREWQGDRGDWNEWDRDRRSDRGFFGSIAHAIGHTVSDLVGTVVWLVALTLLGALFVYFAPGRLETVATEARADVLRSFGVGLAGQLLFFPILLLLVVLIVTWLVIPFYVVAVAVAIPAGYIAVARGLGEAVVDREYELFGRFNLNRQNTYYYVLNGLIVLLAPFALAAVLQLFGSWFGFMRGLTLFAGVVLGWAAATTGFGAVILTRGGGLVRSIPGFRRKRSVPLDDIPPDPSEPTAPPRDPEPTDDREAPYA